MIDKNLIYAPFTGILPTAQFAGQVAAPPYDVLSSAEAKVKAEGKPYSFLHVSKAEIDFDGDVSPYEERVYLKAAENFNNMLAKGVLYKTEKPCFYVYQMIMGDHVQTGLAVAASVKAYNEGRIKRHELTRVAKENDRVKQIRTVGAQTGPALLINKDLPQIKALLKNIVETRKPTFSVVGDYGVKHTLWIVDDNKEIKQIEDAFNAQNEAYIADGHHRSAAASRLAAEDGTTDTGRFLAVAYFEDEMKIWDYNRVVFDLNGHTEEQFMSEIKKNFAVKEISRAKPSKKGTFTMYLNKKWYELTHIGAPMPSDPVSQLDVSLLSAKVLDKILGITDLRNDERIDFIGGIRGAEEIEKVVDEHKGSVGFMVYPTAVAELIAVADNKMLMPPKSTWFEPKLSDGVVSKTAADE